VATVTPAGLSKEGRLAHRVTADELLRSKEGRVVLHGGQERVGCESLPTSGDPADTGSRPSVAHHYPCTCHVHVVIKEEAERKVAESTGRCERQSTQDTPMLELKFVNLSCRHHRQSVSPLRGSPCEVRPLGPAESGRPTSTEEGRLPSIQPAW
jgi:hypothetical protein